MCVVIISFGVRCIVAVCGYLDEFSSNSGTGTFSAPVPVSRFKISLNLTQSPKIRVKGSLSPAPPHARRTRDAALRRDSAEFYRCLRQGVTPNNRALRKGITRPVFTAQQIILTALPRNSQSTLGKRSSYSPTKTRRGNATVRALKVPKQRGSDREVHRGMTLTRPSPQVAKRKT